jgi:hypothetical protein
MAPVDHRTLQKIDSMRPGYDSEDLEEIEDQDVLASAFKRINTEGKPGASKKVANRYSEAPLSEDEDDMSIEDDIINKDDYVHSKNDQTDAFMDNNKLLENKGGRRKTHHPLLQVNEKVNKNLGNITKIATIDENEPGEIETREQREREVEEINQMEKQSLDVQSLDENNEPKGELLFIANKLNK